MTRKLKIQKRLFLLFVVLFISVASAFAQDVITLKSGKEITALVYEIGDIDVKYKKIDNPRPLYTIKKSEISMIKYANGSTDTFNDPPPIQLTEQRPKYPDDIYPEISTQQISQDINNKYFEELVETAPQYPGGANVLEKYLIRNLRYPKSALKKGIQGQVIVRFLVKENGKISDILFLKKLEWNCDHEAVRLVEKMKWIPGRINGRSVKMYYILPINFKL